MKTPLQLPAVSCPVRYFGRKETAEILGVSVRTLDRLVNKDPTFPRPRKIGRSPKWLLSELIGWMEDRKS